VAMKKEGEAQLDRSRARWICCMYIYIYIYIYIERERERERESQGREEHPAYSKMKESKLYWSHLHGNCLLKQHY
jgi:hypothetical protein